MENSFRERLMEFWLHNWFFFLFIFFSFAYSIVNFYVIFNIFTIIQALRFNIIFGIVLQIVGLSYQNYYTNKSADGYEVKNPWLPPKFQEIISLFRKKSTYKVSASANLNCQIKAKGDIKYSTIKNEPIDLHERIHQIEKKLNDFSYKIDRIELESHKNLTEVSEKMSTIKKDFQSNTENIKENIDDLKVGGYAVMKKAYGITFVGTFIVLIGTLLELLTA